MKRYKLTATDRNVRALFLTHHIFFQKRKSLRASVATQRRIKSNGVNDPSTISLVVDKYQRTPERAWPGDSDVRHRRFEEHGGVQPVPRYVAAYTSDVSHLIV